MALSDHFEPVEFLRAFLFILDKANERGAQPDVLDPYTGNRASYADFEIGDEKVRFKYSNKNDWMKNQYSICVGVEGVFIIYAVYNAFPSNWGGHQIQNHCFKKFRLFLGEGITTDIIDHYFTIIALTAKRR